MDCNERVVELGGNNFFVPAWAVWVPLAALVIIVIALIARLAGKKK